MPKTETITPGTDGAAAAVAKLDQYTCSASMMGGTDGDGEGGEEKETDAGICSTTITTLMLGGICSRYAMWASVIDFFVGLIYEWAARACVVLSHVRNASSSNAHAMKRDHKRPLLPHSLRLDAEAPVSILIPKVDFYWSLKQPSPTLPLRDMPTALAMRKVLLQQ